MKVWAQQGFRPLYGPLTDSHSLSGLRTCPRASRLRLAAYVKCSTLFPRAGTE